MASFRPLRRVWPFLALLTLGVPGLSQENPTPAKGRLPGFVTVPAGLVLPGTTYQDYQSRHRGSENLKKELIYEVWSQEAIPPFPLPSFEIGRFEVTNAQWKRYLDAEFKVEHTTGDADTLHMLAAAYVKFRGQDDPTEWKAIYACNQQAIVNAWQEAGKWSESWDPLSPPDSVADLPLAKGLKLTFYKHRIPEHWYGWCKLAGLRVGREYCDLTKPWNEAFVVPENDFFRDQKLRDTDFADYPIRGISPNEALAFAEWAGCELPSEYEFERAGRGDNLTWQFPFGPAWDHSKERNLFPWGDSPLFPTNQGPFRVDDPRTSRSDSPYGARMMLGNVWELTRTFFDLHPDVTPAPPPPDHGLQNYALIAKGGSWGDGAAFLQLSTRTCRVGAAELSLRFQNKADSLGIRLVRHDERPGLDLLLHSILRIAYDPGSATWNTFLPHSFAMPFMAGVDEIHVEAEDAPPHAIFTAKAEGIAFAPLWITDMRDSDRKKDESEWKAGKADRSTYWALGVFRSDVPLRAGIRLTAQQERELRAEREQYERTLEAFKKLPRVKQQQIQLPDPPPAPDDFEKATEKNAAQCGLWREGVLPPGEWVVVYWHGYLGLTNKALTMPPDAIFVLDPKKHVSRRQGAPGPAELTLHPAEDRVHLKFTVNEQATERRKEKTPPREEKSSLWALLEVQPERWTGGKKGLRERPYIWEIEVDLPTAKEALAGHKWNVARAGAGAGNDDDQEK